MYVYGKAQKNEKQLQSIMAVNAYGDLSAVQDTTLTINGAV